LVVVGCKDPYKVKQVEVKGKVTFKGEPLPGGRVTFTPVRRRGGIAVNAPIDENGEYKIMAPVGEVAIAVDNRGLPGEIQRRGPQPTRPEPLKRPGSEAPQELKGQYVAIPDKYYDTASSGLKYKVEDKETQTHDIVLTESPE
jgi:hypothetical protein